MRCTVKTVHLSIELHPLSRCCCWHSYCYLIVFIDQGLKGAEESLVGSDSDQDVLKSVNLMSHDSTKELSQDWHKRGMALGKNKINHTHFRRINTHITKLLICGAGSYCPKIHLNHFISPCKFRKTKHLPTQHCKMMITTKQLQKQMKLASYRISLSHLYECDICVTIKWYNDIVYFLNKEAVHPINISAFMRANDCFLGCLSACCPPHH